MDVFAPHQATDEDPVLGIAVYDPVPVDWYEATVPQDPEAPTATPEETQDEAQAKERKRVRRAFKQGWQEAELTPLDLEPWAVRAAWRITRKLAPLDPGQALDSLPPEQWPPPPTLEQVTQVVETLRLADGSKWDRDQGRHGLTALAASGGGSWPEPRRIVAWETVVLTHTVDWLVKHGAWATEIWLSNAFGLTPAETADIVKVAKARIAARYQEDEAEERALLILRLERLASRAHADLDKRTELNTIKALALLRGLTKNDPENAMDDFVNAIARAKERRDMLTAEAQPMRLTVENVASGVEPHQVPG